MTNSMTRWMIAAAALVVAAGSASAQNIYKAEVPVSFRVQNIVMTPGSYEVQLDNQNGTGRLKVYNLDTHTAVLMIPQVRADAPKAWREAEKPVIEFECSANVCALARLWTGTDSFTYGFAVPKLPSGEKHMAMVTLTPTKAD